MRHWQLLECALLLFLLLAKRSLTDYTTNKADNTKTPAAHSGPTNAETAAPLPKQAPANTALDPNNCYIKGSKSKTYHMPGGSFYERTNPAACFSTEEEAQAAGYRKSSR